MKQLQEQGKRTPSASRYKDTKRTEYRPPIGPKANYWKSNCVQLLLTDKRWDLQEMRMSARSSE